VRSEVRSGPAIHFGGPDLPVSLPRFPQRVDSEPGIPAVRPLPRYSNLCLWGKLQQRHRLAIRWPLYRRRAASLIGNSPWFGKFERIRLTSRIPDTGNNPGCLVGARTDVDAGTRRIGLLIAQPHEHHN
jgi:hypothetical protein